MTETELILAPKGQRPRSQLGIQAHSATNPLGSRGYWNLPIDARWGNVPIDAGVPNTNSEWLISGSFEPTKHVFISHSEPLNYAYIGKFGRGSGLIGTALLGETVQSNYAQSILESGLGATPATSLSDRLTGLLVGMAILVSPEVAARIQELLTLQEGWDGEDAKPVRRESLARVLLLLRTLKQQRSRFRVPFIAPTFDGYLLLDWTAPRRTLEVQAKARGWSVVGTVTHHDGKKDYFSASADQDEADLMKYFEWFRDELLIWPTV